MAQLTLAGVDCSIIGESKMSLLYAELTASKLESQATAISLLRCQSTEEQNANKRTISELKSQAQEIRNAH